jgi:two-component system chemotaxis response regulator CheY
MKKYANKSVLVAEDHPDGRKLVVLLLDKLGVTNVVAVVNGQEAQEQLQGKAFDLLLADWHMPEMDGIGLLKSVKADLSLKSMKVLMVTADDDQKHIMEAILAGADGYLVKPVTQERLQQKLEDIFKDEGS